MARQTGTNVNKDSDTRRVSVQPSQNLTPEQRQIFEAAMAKKRDNDAASKTRNKTEGKYFKRAQKTLQARAKAFGSMPTDVQRSMTAPGSMKTTV